MRLEPAGPLGPGPLAAAIRFPPEGIVDVVWRFHLADGSERFAEFPRVGRNRYAGVIALPGPVKAVTLEMSGSGDPRACTLISLQPLKGLGKLMPLVWRAVRFGAREIQRLIGGPVLETGNGADRWSRADYEIWRERFDERPGIDRDLHKARAARLGEGPTLSLLIEADTGLSGLKATIASLREQFYGRWELIVLAKPEAVAAAQKMLQETGADERIAVRPAAASRAASYNEGLALARGEFIGLIPPGARLPAHALTEIALAIAARPQAKILYTDEDRIGRDGWRYAPRFKPEWSPDFLGSQDYLGHLTLYRARTLRRLGGWRPLEGAEDFDAKLRITDETAGKGQAVLHLPKVLIHVPERQEEGGLAGEKGAMRAVSDHAARQGLAGAWLIGSGRARFRLRPPEPPPLVSIVIPTRDQAAVLRACIRSVLGQTAHAAYEILIVDNGSQEDETIRLFDELRRDERVRILSYPQPFNYSAINNHAVRQARGELIALINNDVEVVSPDWLAEMAAHACRPEIGCVGAKLLYPDGTLQHGGILLGVAGLAGHAHRHAGASAPGYLGRLQSVLNVSAVTAACLVVRRSVYDEVGGMDEEGLATAFNDVDFCLKVRAAGYRNLWNPNAVLIHHESKSRGYERTPAKRARLAAEEDVMRRRWGRALLNDPYYSPHLTRIGEGFRTRRL